MCGSLILSTKSVEYEEYLLNTGILQKYFKLYEMHKCERITVWVENAVFDGHVFNSMTS